MNTSKTQPTRGMIQDSNGRTQISGHNQGARVWVATMDGDVKCTVVSHSAKGVHVRCDATGETFIADMRDVTARRL